MTKYKNKVLTNTIKELRKTAAQYRDLGLIQVAAMLTRFQRTKDDEIAQAIRAHPRSAEAADWIHHYTPIMELRMRLGQI